jgi:hypothetical protein
MRQSFKSRATDVENQLNRKISRDEKTPQKKFFSGHFKVAFCYEISHRFLHFF